MLQSAGQRLADLRQSLVRDGLDNERRSLRYEKMTACSYHFLDAILPPSTRHVPSCEAALYAAG